MYKSPRFYVLLGSLMSLDDNSIFVSIFFGCPYRKPFFPFLSKCFGLQCDHTGHPVSNDWRSYIVHYPYVIILFVYLSFNDLIGDRIFRSLLIREVLHNSRILNPQSLHNSCLPVKSVSLIFYVTRRQPVKLNFLPFSWLLWSQIPFSIFFPF